MDNDHPVVQWVRREVLPLLVERLAPSRVVVFDPPDRSSEVGEHPPGLLIVASAFRGIPVRDRNAIVHAMLAATSPVRPLCLTPEEHRVMERVPGPVLGAARTGTVIL